MAEKGQAASVCISVPLKCRDASFTIFYDLGEVSNQSWCPYIFKGDSSVCVCVGVFVSIVPTCSIDVVSTPSCRSLQTLRKQMFLAVIMLWTQTSLCFPEVKTLARQVVRSRKAVARLERSRDIAQVWCVELQSAHVCKFVCVSNFYACTILYDVILRAAYATTYHNTPPRTACVVSITDYIVYNDQRKFRNLTSDYTESCC